MAPSVRALRLRLQVEPQVQAVSGLLISPSGTTPLPALRFDLADCHGQLQGLLQKWQRSLRACYVLQLPQAERQRVQESAEELLAALRARCQSPSWAALSQILAQYPSLPLVLEIASPVATAGTPDPKADWVGALPWEAALAGVIPADRRPAARPIWREHSLPPASPPHPTAAHARRPRFLLVCGPDDHIQIQPQIDELVRLDRKGRISLTCFDRSSGRAASVLASLADPRGWDAFLYLGHGEPGVGFCGGLALPSGELLAGDRLRAALQHAAPQLVLLSRCYGTDLVPLCLEAGVSWVLVFRGEVPDPVALAAFTPFWQALERGDSLAEASASVAQSLEDQFPGSSPLLSLVARPDAAPLRMPLRRRRRYGLRLARSQRRQLSATAAVLTLGLALYGPSWGSALTLPNVLLDFRLQAQAQWRSWRRGGARLPSPPPGSSPLRVWLLPRTLAYPPGQSQTAVSRQVLQKLLEVLPADVVPMVAFDVVLDRGPQPSPIQPEATAALAGLSHRRIQSGQRLINIFYHANTDERSDKGVRSLPAPLLRQAGLCSTDAGLGIATGVFPLQLLQPLPANSFAAVLADGGAPRCPSAAAPARIPAGSVIDWTLEWFSPQVMTVERIAAIPATPVSFPSGTRVLIGIDHRLSARGVGPSEQLSPNEKADLFDVPFVLQEQPSFEAEIGLGEPLPGPLLQAVLSESLRRRHWFTPLAPLPTTAVAAGLGVLLAAALERWRSRLLVLSVLSLLALPLALELALAYQLLVPLLLPLAALWATCLSRREAKR
ncbi:MAG: hypothetical protein ACK522_10550 [Synechococcaceae cyanobacterium]